MNDQPQARRIPKLQAVALYKDFPTPKGPLRALEEIDIKVEAGEFVCMVGSSGCGKSTLLSIIAGLEPATSGAILVDGEPVGGPGADRGLVFQSYSLYPWRTVAENVAFGLELKKMTTPEIKSRVDRYLSVMGLERFAGTLPNALSGGMQQRTAIARALATEPEVLLLDEPFGALDSQTRAGMQEFLVKVWEELGTTILMVTHSVEEAVFLSQRLYVLSARPGRVAAELSVPFTGTRDRSILRTEPFRSLCQQVDDLLHEKAASTG